MPQVCFAPTSSFLGRVGEVLAQYTQPRGFSQIFFFRKELFNEPYHETSASGCRPCFVNYDDYDLFSST